MTRPPLSARSSRSAGVTLIELAITIALIGILAALIVNFVAPVRSYIDSSRRAALADTADTALRRIGRDVRLALPNSVRVDPTGKYVEFLLVRTGGRYRYEAAASSVSACPTGVGSSVTEDVLLFGAADACFKTIGNTANLSQVQTTDYVVVYNLPTGTDKADAYQSSCAPVCNKSLIGTGNEPTALTGEDRIQFASNTFTYESPGRRYFIIEGAVTYGCTGTELLRYSSYGINPLQVAPPTGGGMVTAKLATGVDVTNCSFTYDNVAGAAAQGAGLVTLSLRLSMKDSRGDPEFVNLYHTVHVNNVP
jgi:MSHA biogenesis protein MshO